MATRTTAKKVATPWGPAALVEEASLKQTVGEDGFVSLVQLLETADGERLLRFAYSTDGVVRRGPVTVRVRDLARVRKDIVRRRELAAVLGIGGA
jgi:hypothetical protein